MRCGVAPDVIRQRLARFELPDMRLRHRQVGGVTVINDAYNANPASVSAAIEELRSVPGEGRRILVLGDMFELGGHSEQLHRKMGRSAARAGIHQVWAVGQQADEVGRGLASVSRWKGQFHPSPSTDDAVGSIPFDLAPGDVVLVKGSRRMRLDRVHDRIVKELGGS
jgi:UDP-N-acetylmuramoyl-tripeptide--D-alanyl-D-alanine ligase